MVALRLDGLSKRFGAVQAVSDVSLSFEARCIHALVGENGAGKSTLLKMAAGAIVPDRGHVRIGEERLDPPTVREAIRRGVGMVQQHFGLVGALSALDNVILGAEPVRALGRLDVDLAQRMAEAAASEMGLSLPWPAPAETLGIGDQQRLAIVRTLVRDPRVVILDEPTAVLTPAETDVLYAALRRMADSGRAVIVATHRLGEVRDHADWVSVMRHGKLVTTRAISRPRDGGEDSLTAIVREVMGAEPPSGLERRVRQPGDVRLAVLDLRTGRAREGLHGVTLSVRSCEIVGVAGVAGNGQRELVRVLAGLEDPDEGEVRASNVVVVHEDRHSEGLVLGASVRDNLVLGELAAFTRCGLVDGAALDREARRRLERAGIVPPDLDAPAGSLSGGNQQKLVVGRAIARADHASVLVLAQPTRGVDVGAARAIHAQIAQAADAGASVLLVSADLGELRALCDRILVMARGSIVAEFSPDASEGLIGEAMLGGSPRGQGAAP